MIHVCYALEDKNGRYTKFVGTSMTSILENANPKPPPWITFHILHDGTLSDENRDKLNYLIGRYGQQIKFYNVEVLAREELSKIRETFGKRNPAFPIGCFYRFFIPKFLDQDIEKVIYLDADTIINFDINEFWNVELGGKVLGAVAEIDFGIDMQNGVPMCRLGAVSAENYFNNGVLLINLNRFRNDNWQSGIDYVWNNPECWDFDQAILNYCYAENYLHLPVRFNYAVSDMKKFGTVLGKNIYHYTGDSLRLDTSDTFNKLWFKYFLKTPWFNESIFKNIFENVRNLSNEQKNLALHVTNILSKKSRGFFVAKENVDAVKKIFAIVEDEEIISAESIENLIQSMKKAQGTTVYFIFAGHFPAVHQALTAAGFVFGRDFINGLDFLSEAHGFAFNTHRIVLNL